jgi:3,5-epimerase/4-reductase
MSSNILVLGSGFIGSRIQQELNCSVSTARINSLKEAQEEIEKHQPKIIINCIGFTGSQVDECELHKDKALQANVFVPLILAEIAFRQKIKLVHISSGCIYNFDYQIQKPIDEEAAPDFFSLFYSRTKIYAERSLMSLAETSNILVARIRIPLDDRPHPKNILTKLIDYKKIIDIPNSVTYIPDFIKTLKHLIKIDAKGIYNTVNSGGLRYSDLLDVYKTHLPDFTYSIIDSADLGLVRTNLILSTKKLEETGYKVRNIHSVLDECVKKYVSY